METFYTTARYDLVEDGVKVKENQMFTRPKAYAMAKRKEKR